MCKENHKTLGTGKVLLCQEVVKGIYHLEVDISEMDVSPKAGQFFMLKAKNPMCF